MNSCHMPRFPVSKSETQTLISVPSLPALCLLLIAIGVTGAHTGDCLIIHSFSTCPSIIQLMQSSVWPFQSIPSRELQSNSGSRDVRLNISFMASLLRSFYYLEFTNHLLSICWLNGPFIRLYVATALFCWRW